MHKLSFKLFMFSIFLLLFAASSKYALSQEMIPLDQVKIYKRVIYEATLKIEKDDKDLDAYKVRGIAHYKLGELYKIVYGPVLTAERKEEIFDEFALAAKDFTSAIKLQKDLYIIYLYRGICYGWMGFSENALKDFSYVVKHDPKNADGYYLRGKEHWRRGEKEKAKEDYDKACDLNPKYKEEYFEP